MSNEINDLPENDQDGELEASDLDQVTGGAAAGGGTFNPPLPGNLGGTPQVGGTVNRTTVTYTGTEVDSQ